MHAKNKLLIVRTSIIFILIITMAGCSIGKTNIDNSNNNDENTGKPIEQKDNKNNYDISRNDIQISLDKDLDNNDQLKIIIYDYFYKYYNVKIPKGEPNIFNINRNVDTENNEIIINAYYAGEIAKHNYYFNIVINQTKRCMERIDMTDYSINDEKSEISSEEAEKIAEEYLMLVDKDKYKSSGTIKIVKNLRDGYQIIFTDKISEHNFVTVSVNPYSLQVTSYVVHWV